MWRWAVPAVVAAAISAAGTFIVMYSNITLLQERSVYAFQRISTLELSSYERTGLIAQLKDHDDEFEREQRAQDERLSRLEDKCFMPGFRK